jgi:hypothetical protein
MRKVTVGLLVVAVCWFAAYAAHASDLKLPQHVEAGAGLAIPSAGSGDGTFYLVGPASMVKRAVKLGGEIRIAPEEVQTAGKYVVVLRSGDRTSSGTFWVDPAKPARMSFIARPSRLPVAVTNGVSGVVYVFDKFHNLDVQPGQVTFKFSVAGSQELTRNVPTRYGMAWLSLDSSRKVGPAQFVASIGDVTERRVVQEVAADPCNLHIRAQPAKAGIRVETDPIRDCSGNPVPDGTIVTFTALSPQGKSSVDARIKKGVATAELPNLNDATVSVASGVVMGNEIRLGGGR